MAGETKQATFSVNLEGAQAAASARAAAEALEALRAKIVAGQSATRELSAELGRLKGKSTEVTNAKQELRAKIQAERDAVEQSTLALLKAGTTTTKLAEANKKAAEDAKKHAEAQKQLADKTNDAKQKAMATAIGAAGGPVAMLQGKLETLQNLMGKGAGATGLWTIALAGMVAAIAAVTGALAASTVAIGRWIFTSANALRTAQLQREAFTNSALSAKNLGDHINELSGKVSTSKEKLQELSLSLFKTRLSGKAIIDTFNAVGHASDAMGDDVGAKFKEIITRGQLVGRLQVNPFELVGTGVDFEELSGNLAKQLGVSNANAKRALFEGRVTIDAGAKAIRTTVEKRFAEINARKALDFNVQLEKLHGTLRTLTRDVRLDPVLKGIEAVTKNFTEATQTGQQLHRIITLVGNAFVGSFAGGAGIFKSALQGAINGTLVALIAFFKLRNALRETGVSIDLANVAFTSLRGVGFAVAGVFETLRFTVEAWRAALGGAKDLLNDLGGLWNRAVAGMKAAIGPGALEIGKEMVLGIVQGIKQAIPLLFPATASLADAAKKGIRAALEIHSPSKPFRDVGRNLSKSVGMGVEDEQDSARAATDAMVTIPDASGSAGSSGRVSSPTYNFHFHVGAGTSPETVAAVKSPDIREYLTRMFEEINASGGAAGAT